MLPLDFKSGFVFSKHKEKVQTPFERLFEIFKELITHTSGDFDEAIDWLRELDVEYKLTDEDYTIDDFIEDLLKKSLTVAKFKIISQNRMGYRIKTPFKSKSKSMLSCAVQPGTVQMTPSGTLLIAGMDGQVSGGYPRIFHAISHRSHN